MEIPGSEYLEIDENADGEEDDVIEIAPLKQGTYRIFVYPDENAVSGDTYDFELVMNGETVTLLEDQLVDDIPTGPLAEVLVNSSPSAVAGGDRTVECESVNGALVRLDGSASTDADSSEGTNDDIVSFEWLLGGNVIATGQQAEVTLPLGVHAITLRVTDSQGATDEDEVEITVQDTTAPSLSVALNPHVLWPANHRLVPITATVIASDLCDPNPAITLVSVTSSESDNSSTGGDGNTSNDIQGVSLGTADFAFSVRAERRGRGVGRVYTVVYAATDDSGNRTERSATVYVPHDQADHNCGQPDCDLDG